MNIVDIAVILSSLFTGSSVIFAIYSYKKRNDQERFANFRISLTDLNTEIEELSELLNSGGYTEIGISISDEIKKLFREEPEKEQIIAYLKNSKNEEYLAQAIFLGLSKSEFLQYSEEIIRSLERKPVEYREHFPILSLILKILIVYIKASFRVPNSVELFTNTILNSEKINEFIDDALDEIDDELTIFREIAIWISYSIFNLHEEITKEVFEEISILASIIIDIFVNANDAQFKQLSKLEYKAIKKVKLSEFKDNPLELLVKLLYNYKSKIELEDWDSLIEAKTKILTKIESGNDE